jgi:AcrR family transcriptional regulator
MPKISQERLLARERGIVQAAARCLQREGLEGTGMRDLFRAANLSPGAVYRYFSSKEELVAAVAAATPSITEEALSGTANVDSPSERLRLLLAAAAAGPPSARLQLELQTAALHSPRIASALAERRAETRRILAEMLSGPDTAAAEEIVDLVLALCEGLSRSRLLDPEADVEAQAAAAGRMLSATMSRGVG